METDAIYIAKDPRSRMHCFIRRVPAECLGREYSPIDPDRVNNLLMARDVEALIEAAANLDPMYIHATALGTRRSMCFKPSELQGPRPLIRFDEPDQNQLLLEGYFDPYSTHDGSGNMAFRQTGRLAKAATKRAIEAYSFTKARDYSFADEQFRYLIEPMQDWIFSRNVLSVSLRIGALLRAGQDREHILDAAGFNLAHPETPDQKKRLGGDCYVIPIGFNPFYREGNLWANDFGFDEETIWPLYSSMTDVNRTPLLKQVVDNHLKVNGHVKFFTAAISGEAKGTFAPRKTHDLTHTWWYLALSALPNNNQIATANMMLQSFDSTLFHAKLAYGSTAMKEIVPAEMPQNLLEAIWLLVRSHPDRYLLTCENCHRTVFSGTQGGERRFCSNACRATWNKEHRV